MPANDLAIYDQEAHTWWNPDSKFQALFHLNAPRFSYFNRFVPDWHQLKVLDVGCGGGFTSEYLAKQGAHVFGMDLSAKSVQAARNHARDNGLKINYQHGSAENLAYRNGCFDVVVCVDVLEHVADLKKVLSEINRVLKNGGLFLFDTINRTFKSRFVMIWLLECLLREIPRGVHDWKLFIKPEDLGSILTQTGFSTIEFKGFDIRGKDRKTGALTVRINDNKSLMYIGKCLKQEG